MKEEVLEEDMDRIIAFYEKKGYIDATAEYTIDYLVKGQIEINIQIEEGRRYSVGSILVQGNEILSI